MAFEVILPVATGGVSGCWCVAARGNRDSDRHPASICALRTQKGKSVRRRSSHVALRPPSEARSHRVPGTTPRHARKPTDRELTTVCRRALAPHAASWYRRVSERPVCRSGTVLGGSSNGRTADSDSACLGSNPSPPANKIRDLANASKSSAPESYHLATTRSKLWLPLPT